MRQLGMIVLLAACSGMALADESRFYAGGNIGQASAEWKDFGAVRAGTAENGYKVSDHDDTRDPGLKIYGGLHFNERVDFRAGYANLGKTVSGMGIDSGDNDDFYIDLTNKTQTLFVDVLTRFQPTDRLSLFTKLGLNLTRSDISSRHSGSFAYGATAPDETDYGFAFAPGLGISYDVTPQVGVVAEYEVYANVGKTHSDSDTLHTAAGSLPKNDVSLLSLGAYYHF